MAPFALLSPFWVTILELIQNNVANQLKNIEWAQLKP